LPSPPERLGIVLATDRHRRAVPAVAGEVARLAFQHSVYGSAVEEEFVVESDGLRLVRVRYGEARLAEFYGHEHARRDGAWWVVDAVPRLHASISVRVSAGSGMRLVTPSTAIDLTEWVRAGDAVRVTVEAAAAE
jgi:hypothetical protein